MKQQTRGLVPEERQEIDLALLNIYRAAWEGEREADPTVLRAAYLQGRVDALTDLGRISPPAPLQVNHHRREQA